MEFISLNIDHAIEVTDKLLSELKGSKLDGQSIMNATFKFVELLAGSDTKTDIDFVLARHTDYESCRAAMRLLKAACNSAQQEAIRLIVRKIFSLRNDATETARRNGERDIYITPITQDGACGRTLLSFVEVFEISLTKVKSKDLWT